MDRYTGFYIDKPIGNNKFSFNKRKNKKIYVPKLIKGGLNDVVLGDEVCFDEVECGKELLCKGLKNLVEYIYEGKKYIYLITITMRFISG
nr:hypothetical protein [Clostridioides mangenotii]